LEERKEETVSVGMECKKKKKRENTKGMITHYVSVGVTTSFTVLSKIIELRCSYTVEHLGV
jgi:hypothetical protein